MKDRILNYTLAHHSIVLKLSPQLVLEIHELVFSLCCQSFLNHILIKTKIKEIEKCVIFTIQKLGSQQENEIN